MKAQKPAEGIMITNQWGNSVMYRVACGCGTPEHDHLVEVEADRCGVEVNIYATVRSDYSSEVIKPSYDIENELLQEAHWFFVNLINGLARRIKLTWRLWVSGTVETETTIAMSAQQAVNYAETLKSAVADLEQLAKENK